MEYSQIEKQMKQWRSSQGFLSLPQSYVDYHQNLANVELENLKSKGAKVHSVTLENDGWGDEMENTVVVLELPNEDIIKHKWNDSHAKGYFMKRCKGGGWAGWNFDREAA